MPLPEERSYRECDGNSDINANRALNRAAGKIYILIASRTKHSCFDGRQKKVLGFETENHLLVPGVLDQLVDQPINTKRAAEPTIETNAVQLESFSWLKL